MNLDYRGISLDRAALVKPQHAADYAKAKSWQRVETKSPDLIVYKSPNASGYEQIVIPRNVKLDDYPERIADVVSRLAQCENRGPNQVLADLLSPDSDTLRFAWEGRDADAGSVSLVECGDLLEGAKRSLLSAACSVLSPTRHHPRLSRTEADQLLSASRLNHTEYGSFVVSISCPLNAVDSESLSSSGGGPFVRQTVSLLMRSIYRLVKAVESDAVDSIENEPDGEPIISSNLCDALLKMLPARDDVLRLTASFAPTLPLSTELPGIPQMIRIPKEYANTIENIHRRLRPAPQPESEFIVGTVETLNGSMGENGRRSGEVTLMAMHQDELVRIRVDLNEEQYQAADNAHMTGAYVKAAGILKPGRRVHRLTTVSEFSVLNR